MNTYRRSSSPGGTADPSAVEQGGVSARDLIAVIRQNPNATWGEIVRLILERTAAESHGAPTPDAGKSEPPTRDPHATSGCSH